MTAEETELTFVRCPSCRSLVPAVATRCRMCGYHFEAEVDEAGGESLDALKTRSRVRQRTLSVSRDEVEEISRHIVAEGEKALDTHGDDFGHSPEDALEDLDEATPAPREESRFASPQDLLEDIESSFGEEAVNDAVAFEEPSLESAGEVQQGRMVTPASPGPAGQSQEGVMRPEGRKRRRRRRKRRGGGGEWLPPRTEFTERSGVQQVEQMKESNMSTSESPAVEGADGRVEERRPAAPPRYEASRAAQEETGSLLGWLVNFEQDSRGAASEIRSGRFFVGRQRLRPHDMVISDGALSTPHCLVFASRANGLKVQDLMSEQGTFIKRRGGGSYVQVHDAVVVEHGDYLRFGGYEVLVCLVPYADMRR